MTDYQSTEDRYTSGAYPKRPVTIVRGQGARLWDDQGREYIDCASGQGVALLGHSHPAVAKAIAEQAQTLITCPEIFYNDQRARLLERLINLAPDGLARAFLCNSGTEAVEGCIKFARLATGRAGIIATMRGFHGRTMGALSCTWEKKYREPFEPLVPDISHVPYDNLQAVEKAIDDNIAGVLIEIVQGEGGVRPGSAEYFRGLHELCTERGALLMVDEVQTGFGRTGRWFACDHFGLQPDLMALAKGMAGGVPMGAVLMTEQVAGSISPGTHGATFGGNPLACAAALAAIQALEDEDLPHQAQEKGVYLLEKLSALDSPRVREVRGLGLIVGIDLREKVQPYLMALLERGILALPAGSTVLRLLPPLVISYDDLDHVVETLAELLR